MITVTLDDTEVRRLLRRLSERVSDLRPALSDIGEALVVSTKRRFADSQGPDGRAWEPLSEVTLARYAEERIGRAVAGARSRAARKEGATDASIYRAGAKAEERATKRLATAPGRRPLVGESKRLSREIVYQVGPGQVEIGSAMIQAAVMQFGARARSFTGGRNPWGDIPARPFIGASDADIEALGRILSDHLDA